MNARAVDENGVDDDEIDLSALVAIPWRRRRLIGLGTLAVTLLAVVYSLLVPRVYLSDGFYQLGNPRARQPAKVQREPRDADTSPSENQLAVIPIDRIGIPIPLFKTSATQFSNPNRLLLYAGQDAAFADRDLQEVKRAFRTAADIHKWISPVYAYARDDAREFVASAQVENAALGLNLSYEAASPETAALYVGLLGRYVRDCLIYVTLFTYVMDEQSRAASELGANEIETLDTRFELEAERPEDARHPGDPRQAPGIGPDREPAAGLDPG